MKTLLAPLVHLNGTGKKDLVDALDNAYGALDEAYAALKRTAPNGRDYYPLGPNAIDTAMQEHQDRLRRLDALMKEVEAMIGAIEAGKCFADV